MTSTIGIPIKLLNEAQGHVITLEITSGQVYRGKLLEAEDNMNVQLKDITVTARDGRVSHLDQVYIRGSHVRFFIVPDMLRNAPMFRSRGVKGRGVGLARGRATVSRARASGRDLTGSAPTPPTPTGSLAGLSHSHTIETAYYTATIPIWLDEIADDDDEGAAAGAAARSWSQEFLAPEAREVLRAIGAFVVAFRKPVTPRQLDGIRALLREVQRVVRQRQGRACGGGGWDGVCLAVGLRQDVVPNLELDLEAWEELCREVGFEWIDVEAKGRNEFNEPVGISRLKEALEANDWAGNDDDEQDLESLEDDEEGDVGFGAEAAQLQMEMFGIKDAIHGQEERGDRDADKGDLEEEETSVEQLEAMMLKMQAMRDLAAGMPEAERKSFAAKAVNDIMKKL
ncbi:MAG: hypothetical protein M1818_001713 [Claussenomyces sp. TS43310]|nr:MAG: hypothetical protein M1818_001713 [Claussenomyces sp. TS43310]